MGRLASALRRPEQRSSLENPRTSLSSVNWPGDGVRTVAGTSVTEETALTLSAVYRAVRIAAEAIASMPLELYQRLDVGKQKAVSSKLYGILHNRPNPEISSYNYWETVQAHVELWGNHYSEIEYSNGGQVLGLWPLMPDRTYPERVNGVKVYKSRLPNGDTVTIPAKRIFHVPGFGFDGFKGKSTIGFARESIGYGLALRAYSAGWFGNGARASGILTHPETLAPEIKAEIRRDWNANHEGLANSHRLAILEQGVKWEQISISPEDSQFLETQKWSVQDISRWFGVPLHRLGDNSMAPASNVEQSALDWVIDGVRPRAVRIEKALNWDVVPQGQMFAEFNLTALLRGDNASRAAFYKQMFDMAAFSTNDILELENRNPVPGGDKRFVPLNMVLLEQAGEMSEDPAPDDEPTPPEDDARTRRLKEIGRRAGKMCGPIVADAVGRCLNKELIAARRSREKAGREYLTKWMGTFYPSHRTYLVTNLTPVLTAFGEAVRELSGADLDVEELVGAIATEAADAWITESRGQLETAMDAASPGPALDDCLNGWEADRAAEQSRALLTGAVARFIPDILKAGRLLPAAA